MKQKKEKLEKFYRKSKVEKNKPKKKEEINKYQTPIEKMIFTKIKNKNNNKNELVK